MWQESSTLWLRSEEMTEKICFITSHQWMLQMNCKAIHTFLQFKVTQLPNTFPQCVGKKLSKIPKIFFSPIFSKDIFTWSKIFFSKIYINVWKKNNNLPINQSTTSIIDNCISGYWKLFFKGYTYQDLWYRFPRSWNSFLFCNCIEFQ